MRHLAVLIAFLLAALGLGANYVTERFDVELTVRPDGTLGVTETIALRFTVPQRGLIRRIPFQTRAPDGRFRSVKYLLGEVTLDTGSGPKPIQSVDREEGYDWQVRIGRPDRTLSGPATYRLNYSVRGALTETAESKHIELFWNVLPFQWATDIPESTVRVRWPRTADPLRARFVLGELGSRRGIELATGKETIGPQELLSGSLTADSVTVKLVQRLAKGQGLTGIIALPLDLVEVPPPDIQDAPPLPSPILIPSNPLGAVVPLLVPAAAWWATRKRQRPRKTPLTARFDAPPGISASEAGLLIDEKFEPRDVVANLITLAQKGAIRLIASGEEDVPATIEILSSPPKQPLNAVEQDLLERLVPYGTVIPAATLRGTFASEYGQHSLQHWLTLERRGLLLPNSVHQGCRVDGCMWVALLVLGMWSCIFLGKWALLGIPLAIVGTIVVAKRVSAISIEGWKVRRDLEGLREFISRANRKELEAMSRQEPAQAIFERLLPFAIAFGYAKVWTTAFDGLNLAPPEWYSDPSATMVHGAFWSDFGGGGFERDWGDAVTYTPPSTGSGFSSGDSGFGGSYDSSSGSFDGGGSAGDGGGGGGGDSW